MDRAWTATLSDIWHLPSFLMWLTIIAAALFAVILVVTLFRAERTAGNGAVAVIALLAVGIAVAAMARAELGQTGVGRDGLPVQAAAWLPALSCLDELAGEAVETACQKAVFASAESTAAAVSHAARQITTLSSFGPVAAADQVMTPDLQALRRAIERDRFGLIAHVLTTRDGCTLSECGFFKSLTNTAQISMNMSEKLYDGLVSRYEPSWGVPAAQHAPAAASLVPVPPGGAPAAAAAAVGVTVPTGKPVSGDFPSSASIPPINIMTAEPPAAPKPAQDKPENKAAAPQRAAPPPSHPAPVAAKKPPAQKSRVQAPVPLAPPPAAEDN